VTKTRDILKSGLVDLAGRPLTVQGCLVMIAVIDPVLLGLSVAVVVIVLVSLVLIARRTGPAGLRHQEAIGELAGSVSRALGSMKTIRATRSTALESLTTVDSARRALTAGLSIAGLKAVVESFSGVALQVLLVVVIGTGGLRVASGSLSTGELSAFTMYLLLMAAPLALVGGIISMLSEALGALSRILEIERLPVERDVEKQVMVTPTEKTAPGCVFEFKDVYFSYDDALGSDSPVALDGVTLSIEEGATTAIVGPSGAGKSTVIALLERFYEPSAGRILFYGRDVQELSRDTLRSQLSYVDQESVALSGTIGQNLRLGASSATDDECAEALVQVGLAANVEAGLALLGHEVGELGSRLSGGERQRLAIARAYLADSPIFLLDEITSNLDSRNEALVQQLILRSAVPRTVVVIAHRFSTVLNADRIIVLDQGRVAATGTHSELLRRSSLYAELAQHQLKPSVQEEAVVDEVRAV
jgi:ATP-binding cassette subfamily B protein